MTTCLVLACVLILNFWFCSCCCSFLSSIISMWYFEITYARLRTFSPVRIVSRSDRVPFRDQYILLGMYASSQRAFSSISSPLFTLINRACNFFGGTFIISIIGVYLYATLHPGCAFFAAMPAVKCDSSNYKFAYVVRCSVFCFLFFVLCFLFVFCFYLFIRWCFYFYCPSFFSHLLLCVCAFWLFYVLWFPDPFPGFFSLCYSCSFSFLVC